MLNKAKNVSYDPANGAVSGARCAGAEAAELRGLMAGFSDRAEGLLRRLLPASALQSSLTASFASAS